MAGEGRVTARFQLSVDNPAPVVAPGASVELIATVQNLAHRLDQVIVALEGLDPAWVTVLPAQLPVFPQAPATARVIITPPNDAAVAQAGLYPVRLRVVSRETGGSERDVPLTLDVRLVGNCWLTLDEAEARGVRQATYTLRVHNGANAPARLTLSAGEPADALWYACEPFAVEAPAGGEAAATLLVQPRSPVAAEQRHTFTVRGEGSHNLRSGGQAPSSVRSTVAAYVQLPAPRLAIEVMVPAPAPDPPAPAAATILAPANRSDPARYGLRLTNLGLAPVTAAVTLDGDLTGLDARVEPARVSLDPQSAVALEARVGTLQPVAAGERVMRALRVLVSPEERDTAAVSASLDFTRVGPPLPVVEPARPGIPLLWWLGLLLCVVGFILLMVVLGSR